MHGNIGKRIVFTVGTVFILVNNQAAGGSSLVEALVTTRCALWHVRVLENHGLRAAGRTDGGMEGLNQTLRRGVASWSGAEQREGGNSTRDGLRQKVELEEADDGLKKSSAIASGIYVQGYPSPLGISEMSPMKADDSGMSKHNTESTQTACLTLHCHSSSLPEEEGKTSTGNLATRHSICLLLFSACIAARSIVSCGPSCRTQQPSVTTLSWM